MCFLVPYCAKIIGTLFFLTRKDVLVIYFRTSALLDETNNLLDFYFFFFCKLNVTEIFICQ